MAVCFIRQDGIQGIKDVICVPIHYDDNTLTLVIVNSDVVSVRLQAYNIGKVFIAIDSKSHLHTVNLEGASYLTDKKLLVKVDCVVPLDLNQLLSKESTENEIDLVKIVLENKQIFQQTYKGCIKAVSNFRVFLEQIFR